MRRLCVVADADVRLHRPAGRVPEVGPWVPSEAFEQAIGAAMEATPPALLAAVRAHLRELGAEDGPGERVLFARLLRLFTGRAPGTLAWIEAAVDASASAAVGPARRLARQADALGARPLARLCAAVADRAAAGTPGMPADTRGALRRELAVTCRVLGALADELDRGGGGCR